MSNWINVDNLWFDDRAAVLTLDRKDCIDIGEKSAWVDLAVLRQEEKIEKLEQFLIDLIYRFNPHLEGFVVHAIGFDPARYIWKVAVSHGSFQAVKRGEYPPELPLIPKEKK